MKLKTNPNGAVSFVLISGSDKVKSTMLESEALELIEKGNVEKKGSRIIVNDKFIFEAAGETREVVEDMPLKEAVKEDKKLTTKKPRKKAKK